MTEVIDVMVDDLYDGCVIMPNCCALDEETKKIYTRINTWGEILSTLTKDICLFIKLVPQITTENEADIKIFEGHPLRLTDRKSRDMWCWPTCQSITTQTIHIHSVEQIKKYIIEFFQRRKEPNSRFRSLITTIIICVGKKEEKVKLDNLFDKSVNSFPVNEITDNSNNLLKQLTKIVDELLTTDAKNGPFGVRIVVIDENYPHCIPVAFRPVTDQIEEEEEWDLYEYEYTIVSHA